MLCFAATSLLKRFVMQKNKLLENRNKKSGRNETSRGVDEGNKQEFGGVFFYYLLDGGVFFSSSSFSSLTPA